MSELVKPMTGKDHEIAALKRSIDNLEKENRFLKDFCIDQQKKLDGLQNRTGWDKFNDSLLTLGEHRLDDAISRLVKQRHLRDQRHGISGRDSGFQVEAQTEKKRRSTLPSSTTQPEIKKQGRALRRVESVAALAGRFTSLFKKSKKGKKGKGKEKDRDDDIAESVDGEARERAKDVMAEWEEREKLDQEHKQRLVDEQKIRPHIIKHTKIAGEHEQLDGWKLQQAQEEYKKSMENEKAPFSVRKGSINTRNGRHGAGKESLEVEEELVVAMERDYLASFPANGSVRTVNWPEGRRITGSIFKLPHPAVLVPQALPAQTAQRQPYPPPVPPPTRAPPAIPHKSRPRQTRPPPPPPAPETDDVFRFSCPATPPSQATRAAENQRVQRLRHRRSAPSPTPRFITHRPASPSPGGNDPMPSNPVPSWLKTRKGEKSK
jgi:hypothetical protein